jgi:hypothetical protein
MKFNIGDIEQDTKEETLKPMVKSDIRLFDIESDSDLESPIGLGYETHYKALLEENTQIRQENESMRDIISMMGDLL